jgi:hypothetical protein
LETKSSVSDDVADDEDVVDDDEVETADSEKRRLVSKEERTVEVKIQAEVDWRSKTREK